MCYCVTCAVRCFIDEILTPQLWSNLCDIVGMKCWKNIVHCPNPVIVTSLDKICIIWPLIVKIDLIQNIYYDSHSGLVKSLKLRKETTGYMMLWYQPLLCRMHCDRSFDVILQITYIRRYRERQSEREQPAENIKLKESESVWQNMTVQFNKVREKINHFISKV